MVKPTNQHIILFDGVCNLCNRSVRFIHKRDHKNQFLYQSLQSDEGKKLLQQIGNDDPEMSSIVLVSNNELYTQSTAVLNIAKILGFPYSLLYVFIIIPPFVRNALYRFVARNRYKWFGKKEVCEFDPLLERKMYGRNTN